MMKGIVFALGCAFFIALSQLLLKKSYKEFKPSIAFFFDALFGLILWVPLALIMGVQLGMGLREAAVFALISAVLSEAIVFYALSHGELALTATVLATYPAYTVLFSWLINGEQISYNLLIFVLIAIGGSALATVPNRINKKELKESKLLWWPFIAAVSIGFSDTISKGYINRSADFSLLFMLGFVQVPVALAYLRIEKQRVVHAIKSATRNTRVYQYALLGGLFNIIGTGLLWLSFSYAPASIASPLTGFNGALTVILSHLVLKERLSVKRYLAIGLAFIGVIGIILSRS